LTKGAHEIPSSKHQITNKSQIPIPNDPNCFGILNFGNSDLFVIWDLEFGISSKLNTSKELAILTNLAR
jgi:hypothetical protein